MRLAFLLSIGAVSVCMATSALAQEELPPPPPEPDAPPASPPDEPAPAPAPPAQAAPPTEAAAQPPPQPQPPSQPQPAAQPQPQPQPAAQPQPQPAPPQRFDGQVSGEGEDLGFDYAPPEQGGGDPGGGFEMPAFSIRLDPLNWLLEGRLGFELEVQLWELITLELVPVFVANEDPPLLDLRSLDEELTQHSNGIGALSGTSLGVGFWLDGEPFSGTVLRAILTNYGYTFRTSDASGVIDRVDRTERRFAGFIGSYSRFGFFTIGGGLSIGYELNQQQRCDLVDTSGRISGTDSGCDELLIAVAPDASTVADLNGFVHPVYLEARLSLGVAFD